MSIYVAKNVKLNVGNIEDGDELKRVKSCSLTQEQQICYCRSPKLGLK